MRYASYPIILHQTVLWMLLSACRNSELQLIPVPTPRWPDLLCVYHSTDRLLFTSNLFSAHVAPSVVNTSGETAADVGGWDMYGQDWRHYYDCMLAPVAKQAAGVSAVAPCVVCCMSALSCCACNAAEM